MEDLCYIEGCPGIGKFNCSCNGSLRVCQDHISEHIKGLEYHEIRESKLGTSHQKASDAIKLLNKLSTKTLKKGKEMFKELFDKLCNVVDDLSQRQQWLFELGTLNHSEEIDRKIKELEEVNITLRDKKDFRKVLENFMSSEKVLESSNFDELRKDLKIIVESLGKSNEVLQTMADSNKTEQAFRGHLENRIIKLEQNSSNLGQKIEIIDVDTKQYSINLKDFQKEVEKAKKNSIEIEIAFKEKMIESRQNGKQLAAKIEALENSLTKSVDETMKLLNEKHDDLRENITKIKGIRDQGFKQVLEELFNEIYIRRIVNKKLGARKTRSKKKARRGRGCEKTP